MLIRTSEIVEKRLKYNYLNKENSNLTRHIKRGFRVPFSAVISAGFLLIFRLPIKSEKLSI